MNDLIIYRKRFIPDECILLKDDAILSFSSDKIITKWTSFNPRPHLMRGYSCYYLYDSIKLSKMIHSDNSFHWYIDIADYSYDKEKNSLVMTDLLADVIIGDDSVIKVVDLDELSLAFEQRLITENLLKKSLCVLNRLLEELYSKGIGRITEPLVNLI